MAAFNDLIFNQASNDTAAEFVRGKIREIGQGPREGAELLAPNDHPIGTKRICVDTDYYETYNRPNVDPGRSPRRPRSRPSRQTAVRTTRRDVRSSTPLSSPPASTP